MKLAKFLAGLAVLTLLGVSGVTAWAADIIGAPGTYVTQEADTLLDVAHVYDLGYVEIRAANPGVDPWLPGAGVPVLLPTQHVLPKAPRRGIVINLAELRLYYFPSDGEPRSFPIGIGREGYETPVGRTSVLRKRVDPAWVPTKSEREENPDLPAVVGPGPDNPMGKFALYLAWPSYAIHGTNQIYSIGRRGSHGCIRLYPEDIEWLFRHIELGAPVLVVDQPAKVGWLGGELYLEVHSLQADADSFEQTGSPRSELPIDARALVLEAAGEDVGRLDWDVIHRAEIGRRGMPIRITRPKFTQLY